MGEIDVGELIIYMVVLIFAISAHEAAHAWTSSYFGDDTARLLGRVTLNPVSHTDPIGTLLIPIFGYIFAGSGPILIGWGRPTPVNPLRWRNKNVANVMVSIAGILVNTFIAICALIIIKVIFQYTGLMNPDGALAGVEQPLKILLLNTLFLNASLALFNLLPFPPLDGSKVLETFLPSSWQSIYAVFEQYGFIILIVLINLRVFDAIFAPFHVMVRYLLQL
ncbi:MAG: site-2 protease family protein [Pyrinomonadaceae bacterium]